MRFCWSAQATFLAPDTSAAAEPRELRAELDALADDALELRCRRAGLSRRGGRAEQIGRLLSLHAYLSGDRRTPAPPAPERAPSNSSADAVMIPAPTPASGWVLGGTRGAGAVNGPPRPADGVDEPDAGDLAGRAAAEAETPSEPKSAVAAKPPAAQRPKPAEPVSRWTTVDDADDGNEEPIAARIAAGAAALQSSDDDEDLFKGAPPPTERPPLPPEVDAEGDMPGEADAEARSAGGATPPTERDVDPEAVTKAARAAKDDEERRQRLRQVRLRGESAGQPSLVRQDKGPCQHRSSAQ